MAHARRRGPRGCRPPAARLTVRTHQGPAAVAVGKHQRRYRRIADGGGGGLTDCPRSGNERQSRAAPPVARLPQHRDRRSRAPRSSTRAPARRGRDFVDGGPGSGVACRLPRGCRARRARRPVARSPERCRSPQGRGALWSVAGGGADRPALRPVSPPERWSTRWKTNCSSGRVRPTSAPRPLAPPRSRWPRLRFCRRVSSQRPITEDALGLLEVAALVADDAAERGERPVLGRRRRRGGRRRRPRHRPPEQDEPGRRAEGRAVREGQRRAIWTLQAATSPEPEDQVVPLSPQTVGLRFAAARAAGVERVTAHSGRVGLASELTSRGASTTDVMLAGNWKTSRMVAHYSAGATAERGAVARYL